MTFNTLKAAFFLKSKKFRICSLLHAKIQFFNFEIAVYGFMATSFQRTVWGSVDGGGIGKFLVVGAVGSSMGEIWKEWGSVLGCGGR